MTPMDQHIARAVLLLQQSRYELAEQELRQLLAESPHDAQAHALLAVALSHQDKLDDAEAESGQAIVLAPDWAYSHFCRSLVMEQRRRFREAEQSAREAVRLDPGDADYRARLAMTLFTQGQWQATLDAAEEGLALDGDHAGCTQLRTMALTKLNRQSEAIATVDASLARDPDDALAHCNKGWALLHQSKPRPALEHFREALRIDPTFEYARMGMIEALKAKNPIYRVMLAYFLWMARLSPQARWGVILAGYFGSRILRTAADNSPALAPWVMPILVVYIAFVVLTWFAVPLFNLLLRLNRFGRHALSRDQRVGANWFGVCLLGALAGGAWYMATGAAAAIASAVVALGLAMPVTTAYMCDKGWPRKAMLGIAAGMAAVGAIAISGAAMDAEWGFTAFSVFLLGVIASPWAANVLAGATPTR
jgi:tetratricopeptide (TPR) repeat protein